MSDVPRLVTVWCADWPLVAARVAADQPAAVMRANRVVCCTPAARRAGVEDGDRRRRAQSVCPDLQVLDADPARDGREFEPIVRAIAELAPRVEVIEPGSLCVAARGPSRYFGGDVALAERLVAIVSELAISGYGFGVGIADGRAASALAARSGSRRDDHCRVVAVGQSPAFVEPLSIGWLRQLGEVDAELVDLFARLGLRTMGSLAALEVGDVLGRFGPIGLHAHRLAGGADLRPPSTTDPQPEWWVEELFEEPIEQLDTVAFVVKRLADQLVSQLATDGRVCVRLVIVVETEHGERSERVWYRDLGLSTAAIVERARWQLEGWAAQPGGLSGGVAMVRLLPDEVRSDDGVQTRLWGGRSQADDDAARAIMRLTGLAGEQAVTVPVWEGGRLPTDRYRMVPAIAVDLDDTSRLDRGAGPWPGSTPLPSPAIVAVAATDAMLFDVDGEVVRVTGRGEVSCSPAELVLGNRRQRVAAWAGPWPVEQRWWSPDRSRRVARMQIVTDCGEAYLLGLEHQRWSLLATYA